MFAETSFRTIMKKHYHITIALRNGGDLIPEESLRTDETLIGVFASTRTGVLAKGFGGTSAQKEYVVYADRQKAEAFADEVVSRYIDYRAVCLLGLEKVDRNDYLVTIEEIDDNPQSLERILMDMIGRTYESLGFPAWS